LIGRIFVRFTFNWLKHYLSTDFDATQIADKLTEIGLEVESLEDPNDIFNGFKIVQIENAEQHPDADRLKICLVKDARGNAYKIVCGAKNARAGIKTVLATPGAVIPSSNTIIKKSKLRGVESEGMLCSKQELSILSDEDGIIEIDNAVDLSTAIGDALEYGGGIFDVAITPNRGDCLSVKGIARDLAATGAGEFICRNETPCKEAFKFPLKINHEKSNAYAKYAPIIAFRVIKGIKNAESPAWLKKLINASGMNSISTVVDLSNFCLVDSGRPLHIYDLNKMDGQLSIRFAKDNEKFVDLKGNEHILHQDMLISADDSDPLCLMGIIGSSKAGCDEDTTDILIESGMFDPVFISRTGASLNINTDSKTRFEKGIDRDSCVSGLEGITKAILDECGGTASDILVIGSAAENDAKITLRKSKLHSLSGASFDWLQSKEILRKLGLKEISSTDDSSVFSVPSWRSDLNIEEDLIEEIMRIAGYDNIKEEKFDTFSNAKDKLLKERKNVTSAKRLLASGGLSEITSYSFMKNSHAEAFKEDKKLLHLLNPISEELEVMRPSLIPSLILAASRSLNYGKSHIELFEEGNVYHGDCEQSCRISGLRTGNVFDRSWLEKSRKADVFDAKADLLKVLGYYGITENEIVVTNEAPSYYHPSRSASVYYAKKKIADFGELHPKINKLFSISTPIVCFELELSNLRVKSRNYLFNSKVFPVISRDFSFIFDSKISIGNLVNSTYKLDPRITKVDVFDCFEIANSRKSIGIAVVLSAEDRTLTENEAQEISEKIVKYVGSVGGELRSK
jgi:phenylalanyl-tRNA synthetase beta chain